MLPTIGDEMAGALRLVDELAGHRDLPEDLGDAVVTLRRVLQRVERSWPKLLPWLLADNVANAALLADLAPLLPSELVGSANDALAAAAGAVGLTDLASAEQINVNQREVLARIVAETIHDDQGGVLRSRIAARLLDSLEGRPW